MELSERLNKVNNLRRAAMSSAKFKESAKQHEAALRPKSPTLPKSKPRCSFADWAGGK
ncbi:hypothetical protein QTO01_11340 [Vibrio mytili]|uniref:hypothetical protein n=1 Tax=Vibrio mytili TaxID=50718 RepID=UPI002F414451